MRGRSPRALPQSALSRSPRALRRSALTDCSCGEPPPDLEQDQSRSRCDVERLDPLTQVHRDEFEVRPREAVRFAAENDHARILYRRLRERLAAGGRRAIAIEPDEVGPRRSSDRQPEDDAG